jgi:hypothetical protein
LTDYSELLCLILPNHDQPTGIPENLIAALAKKVGAVV